jgi:hypothetical protein
MTLCVYRHDKRINVEEYVYKENKPLKLFLAQPLS